MDDPFVKKLRKRRCKSFNEVNAYCKAYWLQLHKQYEMHLIKKAKPFIDIKIPRSKLNECLSSRSYWKTNKGNAISYKNPLYSFADEQDHRLAFKEKLAMLVMAILNNKLMTKFFAKKVIMKLAQDQDLTRSQKDQA